MTIRAFHLIALLVAASCCWAQTNCGHVSKVVQQLKANHLQPPPTQEIERNAIEGFFQLTDPYAFYFSKAEITPLLSKPISFESGDQVCQLVKQLEVMTESKLRQVDSYLEVLLKTKLNYNIADSLKIESKNGDFPATEMLQKQKLDRWIKYQVLDRMLEEADTSLVSELLKFEAFAREKVLTRERKRIHRLIDDKARLHTYVTNTFVKAIAASFDPHTSYFSSEEMLDFKNDLSSTVQSFGLDFSEDETGQATVSAIAPGGGAWNSNEIHEGDVILSIKWSDKEKIDARDFSPEELQKKMELNAHRSAEITIRKKDGTQATVKLEKTDLDSDDNNVDGMLLTGKKKIGYISLPAFYTNWDDPNRKGCAADVASELIKLKKENIDGLILDLRFNGGGSNREAVELAGIFIDVGPLMIMQVKGQPLFTLKETTPGAIYQGPLLILVNGLSASAAELVTAALQDHKRAIVVGTPTFGKASGQSIVPVVEKDTIGFIKVTSTRLYRITGKSYQQEGVKPDIMMPDFSSLLNYHERLYRNSLKRDSITKKTYYTPLAQPSIEMLKQRSADRTDQSLFFKQVSTAKSKMERAVPLQIDAFIRYEYSTLDFYQMLDGIKEAKPDFKVSHNRFNQSLLQIDESRKDRSDLLSEEIEQSPYLREAYNILLDYIELEKNKRP